MSDARLTERERLFVELIASGKSDAEIGLALRVKPSTVRAKIHYLGRLIPGNGPPRLRILKWRYEQILRAYGIPEGVGLRDLPE